MDAAEVVGVILFGSGRAEIRCDILELSQWSMSKLLPEMTNQDGDHEVSKDFGKFWCFLTGYYRYFDSCKLCVECRQCKRTIGHFPLHDNFRLFRRVQD